MCGIGVGGAAAGYSNSSKERPTLDFYNGYFSGISSDVKVRPDGSVRVGCTIVTKKAIEEIARLSKMGEYA